MVDIRTHCVCGTPWSRDGEKVFCIYCGPRIRLADKPKRSRQAITYKGDGLSKTWKLCTIKEPDFSSIIVKVDDVVQVHASDYEYIGGSSAGVKFYQAPPVGFKISIEWLSAEV